MADTATTLTGFKNALKDVARPNRFLVVFSTAPVSIPANITFFASKAMIPKMDISGPTIKFRGTTMHLPGDPKHEPITLTFINAVSGGNKLTVRQFFENWLNWIGKATYQKDHSKINTRKDFSEVLGYRMDIEQLSSTNRVLATYRFHDVMPLEVGEMELDQGSSDAIMEFNVVFQYSEWEIIDGIGI